MRRSMTESGKLFEQVKKIFLNEKRAQFVIEISDRPMAEWQIINVRSPEEMFEVRGRLSDKGVDFAGFINFEGNYTFYYIDQNFFESQYVESGEVITFHD